MMLKEKNMGMMLNPPYIIYPYSLIKYYVLIGIDFFPIKFSIKNNIFTIVN